MNSISAKDFCNDVNNDTTKHADDSFIIENVHGDSTGTETVETIACIATPITVSTSTAVVSLEVPKLHPSMAAPASAAAISDSHDNTSTHYTTEAGYQKKAGHHFYYVPPSTTQDDDFRRAELPLTSSNDSNDPPQQLSHRLHQDSTFLQQRDQTLSSKFPSSPMVTPPVHKSYVHHGTSRGETSVTAANISTSAHENQNIIFHRTNQPQQRQQAQQEPLLSQHVSGVPHVYHDYISHTSWNENDDEHSSTFIRKKTGGVSQPFPEKLHEMLTTVENTNEKDIVTWLPHGRAFIVRKPKEFTDFIMPKYFKQTKLTSFQRQLNLYGFRRLTQGPDAGAYYHELFLRVRPSLCQRMTRQKVKGTGHKQPADAKTEPNFYEMSSLSSIAQQARRTTSLNNTAASLPHQLPSSSNPPLISDNRDLNSIDFLNESTRQLQPHQLQYHRHNRAAMNPMSVEISNRSVPAESVLDSPGLQCAAHLLQGIASGYIKNNLHIPTSDALSTGGLEDETEKELLPFERSSDEGGNRRSTSFLQPRMSNEYR